MTPKKREAHEFARLLTKALESHVHLVFESLTRSEHLIEYSIYATTPKHTPVPKRLIGSFRIFKIRGLRGWKLSDCEPRALREFIQSVIDSRQKKEKAEDT